MYSCLFATDLHGRLDRYEKLFRAIETRMPRAVFLGGDLLPHFGLGGGGPDDFLGEIVAPGLESLRNAMGARYPDVFVILGNDDLRVEEAAVLKIAKPGLWKYAHSRRFELGPYRVYGYACVPPTPFLLKDWEKYDVSRYTPPGSVSPEEGRRSIPVDRRDVRNATIAKDLRSLVGDDDLASAVLLFHTPPNNTNLDRAATDGKEVDHVPLDLHVGSIAVRRLIESRQPLATLHGHIHESTRLTGSWRDLIGRTHMFNAAHDGPELAVVTFDLEKPGEARRELL
jgi:Icc-related predicted phosphoesterase